MATESYWTEFEKFRPFLWESYIFILVEKPMGKRVLCRKRYRRLLCLISVLHNHIFYLYSTMCI